jgi:hypothetical protein
MFLPVINGSIDISPVAHLMRKELVTTKPKKIDMAIHDAVNSDLKIMREKRMSDQLLAPIMQPYEQKGFLGGLINKLQGGR